MDCLCTSFAGWLSVSEVVVAVCVLAVSQVVVLAVVATAFVDVVGRDVAEGRWGSGLETGGWGVCSRAVYRLGRVWRRFQSLWGWFKVGEAVVVAVVDAVINDDMAVVTGGSGCERRGWGLSRGAVDWPGIQRRLSGGAGSGSDVEEERLVVVVNNVGVVEIGRAHV